MWEDVIPLITGRIVLGQGGPRWSSWLVGELRLMVGETTYN